MEEQKFAKENKQEAMVELLCLMKEDFANVLQASLQHHWDDCKRAMQQFPYFNGWDEVAVRECCILSKLKSYGPDQMMLGDGVGQPNYVYFVLQGTCRVVQNVRFAVRLVAGQRKYRLFPEVETHLKKGEKLERFFVQVCLMDKGSCFGLGEDMQDRRVIAVSKVECLLIPQYWIMQHNRANIWVRIRQFLDQNIPSQVQIFKAFLEHRKWLHYKQELVKEIVSRKKIPNNTTIHDVPYSLRINSDTIPDSLNSASMADSGRDKSPRPGTTPEEETGARKRHDNARSGGHSSSEEGFDQGKRLRTGETMMIPGISVQTMVGPGVAASPPKFVSLEEIMKAAKDIKDMSLVHEIAVDRNFKLEKFEPPPDSRPLYLSSAPAQAAPTTPSTTWTTPQSMFSEPSVTSSSLYSAPMRPPLSVGSLGGHYRSRFTAPMARSLFSH
uniref:Cyclic nucleotide-binding domain-containing protein n=1 Tax=Timema cristinae TaxID=61476 RepID=A0A7R9D3C5_TIMCR|nr:unnamed protein product [Timema cristinae]